MVPFTGTADVGGGRSLVELGRVRYSESLGVSRLSHVSLTSPTPLSSEADLR